MAVEFRCTTRTSLPAAALFDRSRSVEAHTASMEGSRERAVAGTTSGLLGPGDQVTWRAWHFGVPLRMTSRITAFDAPHAFVDEQVRGPFRSFRHEHWFHEDAHGTTMVDRVRFEAPLGVLGRLAEKVVLARYLRTLIEQRNEHLISGP
ncbi:SRPBCC family protein [Zhihengliuella flava]|uniref:Ligand-binding SRPBCC domain-containing protein n=1 Tax=Zhihengliuella flava TaxID=1285193 RepID=A0A931DCX9_9MICC|nr:SRPBCC family protein [Zhihengliuella flava]MBG6084563.1 ligand-binding SRPBCC domain-containing protein [Zhihengliuella flava]